MLVKGAPGDKELKYIQVHGTGPLDYSYFDSVDLPINAIFYNQSIKSHIIKGL